MPSGFRARLSAVGDDLRAAGRGLRHQPGFSALAIATMAVAIGANTAMFSFVNGVLLRPLPYPDADRIVRVLERLPDGGPNAISTLNYLDWAHRRTAFQYLAAEAPWRATLTGGDEPIAIQGARVSPEYFDIFGTTPALGRGFHADEDQPGHDHVVLLSHRLWAGRLGSDAAILHRHLTLDGESYAVVGVLPKDSPFDRAAAEIWKPLSFGPADLSRNFRWLGATAKLKDGETLEHARAEMDVIARDIARAHPESNAGWGVAVDRLADVVIGPGLRQAVLVLCGATTFVLLIGCANVANLMLARSLSRTRDVAVRAALGASRWRLIQRSLLESAVMALCGGALGVVVGRAILNWIQSLLPPFSVPPGVDLRLDLAVLLFTLGIAAVTGLLCGAAPAARAARPNLVSVLNEGRRGAVGGGLGPRLRGGLVIAEMTFAFVLLVAAGLLMRSVLKLLDVDPGFTAANVLTMNLPMAPRAHRDPVELNAYLESIAAAVAAVPGVSMTAMSSALPLEGGGFGMPYSIESRASSDAATRRRAFFKIVTPSYMPLLGIRLRAGRLLNDRDRRGAPRVMVINDAFARREFPDEDPLGHHVQTRELVAGRRELGEAISWEIVGVIAGERVDGLGDEVSAGMYVSNQQSPTDIINLLVRTSVPPLSVQQAVQSAVDAVNRDQAVSDVRTLEQIVDRSMLANRVMSTLLTAFATLALLLAMLGIYGVIAHGVAERAHEIGVRSALGATISHLRGIIVWSGLRLALVGLFFGTIGTFAVAGALSSMLFGVGALDLVTLAGAALVLAGVAALACVVPAWRITRVDPAAGLLR